MAQHTFAANSRFNVARVSVRPVVVRIAEVRGIGQHYRPETLVPEGCMVRPPAVREQFTVSGNRQYEHGEDRPDTAPPTVRKSRLSVPLTARSPPPRRSCRPRGPGSLFPVERLCTTESPAYATDSSTITPSMFQPFSRAWVASARLPRVPEHGIVVLFIFFETYADEMDGPLKREHVPVPEAISSSTATPLALSSAPGRLCNRVVMGKNDDPFVGSQESAMSGDDVSERGGRCPESGVRPFRSPERGATPLCSRRHAPAHRAPSTDAAPLPAP